MRCVASHLSEIIGKDERVFTYLINCSGFKVMFIITTTLIHLHSNCFYCITGLYT